MPPDDRKSSLEALRRPALSNLARKGILKKVNTKCRKASQCPYCEALNGETCSSAYYVSTFNEVAVSVLSKLQKQNLQLRQYNFLKFMLR